MSRRKISTVIIGSEVDFQRRKRLPDWKAEKLIRTLKDYVNLRYETEATIAVRIGLCQEVLQGWLSGKAKQILN